MKNKQIILLGVVFIALLCSIGTVTALADNSSGAQGESVISDDSAPYQGPISADSPLYGLKIAMEDLDETFTFNDTQRVEKQVDHARLRIAEVRRELSLNRTDTAERAMEQYRQKLNLTEMSLTPFASNATGLLHAQEMIARHQDILANLSLLYPNNTGLARAYNNSLELEIKFEQKTETRFARFIEKDNKTIFKAVRLEIGNQNRISDNNTTAVETIEQDRDKLRDRINNQKDVISVNRTISTQTGNQNVAPALNKNPPEGKGSSRDTGKNGRN
ncbi:MAG: DUF5667 domain-containing protein [Methanoregula sp.]